jgi:signal transduction histidine kinase
MSALRGLSAETHRLGNLVHDFRLLAQTQYAFEPVFVNELILDILKVQAGSYAQLGIRVEVDFPATLPSVTADRNKLKQVLLNLCKNAVEAMSAGGILTIAATCAGETMVIEIRDTGGGIPDNVEVFEPFVTTKEHGTGLGLPLVRQILSSHGGTVVCASEPGNGTTFRLTLPVRQRN